eukprot:1739307-Alexandrium_andersonii.AAC.1
MHLHQRAALPNMRNYFGRSDLEARGPQTTQRPIPETPDGVRPASWFVQIPNLLTKTTAEGSKGLEIVKLETGRVPR